ncbi:MAG: NGG1p interacting factor NIF3 [Oligoflexales bacterium]|nr:NGG1p interacting factor NIF3 [Oligoflexales bacterium]
MYKLCFYVPPEDAENVKTALFNKGAGKIGNYEWCSFETPGDGQYRPLEGSSPYRGEPNRLERVKELRVEMVCEDHLIREVVKTLLEVHPYETPAYDVVKCEKFDS